MRQIAFLLILFASAALAFSRMDLKRQFDANLQRYEQNGNLAITEMKKQKSECLNNLGMTMNTNTSHLLHCYFTQITKSFPMSEQEYQLFTKNGLVVSEQNQMATFLRFYEQIFTDDLPVFITADSILHAWHRSFDALLKEMEEKVLYPAILVMMDRLLVELRNTTQDSRDDSAQLLDVFLCVTRALLENQSQNRMEPVHRMAVFPGTASIVHNIVAEIDGESSWYKWHMFGVDNEMNFASFKPRGHYTKSLFLQSYFRAMMWLGTFPFVLTEKMETELCAVDLLVALMNQTGQMAIWKKMDNLLNAIVGVSDSVTFVDWAKHYRGSLRTDEDIEQFVARLRGKYADGTSSAIFRSTEYNAIVFNFMGQRFTLDSWIMNNVVSHSRWDFPRLISSGLDVMGAMGNLHAFGYMLQRMENGTVQYRDNIPYANQLLATKQVLDKFQHWNKTLQLQWLQVIQELAKAPIVPKEWSVFQTCAWNDLALHSQLASWTQLRHDMILYQKQSEGIGFTCEYPFVFIDPRESFWTSLIQMVTRMLQAIEENTFAVTLEKLTDIEMYRHQHSRMEQFSTSGTAQLQVDFLDKFLQIARNLSRLATKQNHREPFTKDEFKFATDIVRIQSEPGAGCAGPKRVILGWYIDMYYDKEDAKKWDPIVADVHSWNDCKDNTGVLFNAIGSVNLMTIAVPLNSSHAVAYAAPVYSHYEFAQKGYARLNDKQWSEMVNEQKIPDHSLGEWTRSFLVQSKKQQNYYFHEDE